MNNDVDVLLVRFDFVKRTEPRTNYMHKRVYFKKITLLNFVLYM